MLLMTVAPTLSDIIKIMSNRLDLEDKFLVNYVVFREPVSLALSAYIFSGTNWIEAPKFKWIMKNNEPSALP
ncbi:hypothetical protein YK56LOC_30840 [Caballeronia sp. HLA56]